MSAMSHPTPDFDQDVADAVDFAELLPAVYGRLHALASSARRSVAAPATLNTTALVHEMYLKLATRDDIETVDRNRFFALCAQTMRHRLIDRLRAQAAGKRTPPPPKTDDGVTRDAVDSMLNVDVALTRLARRQPRLVQLVECRVFAGYTMAECAQIMGVTERTVGRDWLKAKAWLGLALDGEPID